MEIILQFSVQNITNVLHDADLFLNTTTDEMSDVFDETFNVFNGEIDNVASDFTDFIDLLFQVEPFCISLPESEVDSASES